MDKVNIWFPDATNDDVVTMNEQSYLAVDPGVSRMVVTPVSEDHPQTLRVGAGVIYPPGGSTEDLKSIFLCYEMHDQNPDVGVRVLSVASVKVFADENSGAAHSHHDLREEHILKDAMVKKMAGIWECEESQVSMKLIEIGVDIKEAIAGLKDGTLEVSPKSRAWILERPVVSHL